MLDLPGKAGILCHATPCHASPCHISPCHASPCHTSPCSAVPCHAVPCRRAAATQLPSRELPCWLAFSRGAQQVITEKLKMEAKAIFLPHKSGQRRAT